MKIELKNIKHSPSLSEETEAFTANLYINDKHAGFAKNSGHGGSTDYSATNEQGQKLIREAEVYCTNLPPLDFPAEHGMKAFSVDMTLELMINELLDKHLSEKDRVRFNNKLNKAMEKGIMYGIPDKSFGGIVYKVPLETLLKSPKGTDTLKATIIRDVLPELKGDIIVLNTNIPGDILKAAGLKEGQYVKPATETKQLQKPGKKPGINQ